MAITGLRVTADDVIVTNGTMEAITLSLGVLCRPGDTVLVESPTYFGVLQVLEHLGLNIVEVPNDPEDGIDVQALEYVVAGTKIAAAVLQSSFNNPAGSATSDAAKRRIVEILASRGIPLVEDDIYGDLHFGNERPTPFGAFDGSGQVITCGSISKTVAIGYRIGWAISPALRYGDRAREILLHRWPARRCSKTSSRAICARAATSATCGACARTCAPMCERFTDTIARDFPSGTRASHPRGGVVLWVELPRGCDGVELFHAALAHRIGIAPGIIFSATGAYRNFVRLSAGVRWTPEVEKALNVLGKLARRQTG